ncbi:MAG: thioredoxin family protein [Luteolibacter sp.]
MKRTFLLLPLIIPFLGSCDKITAVTDKVGELKDLRTETVSTATESMGLNELADTGDLQGEPAVSTIDAADFNSFIAQPGKLNIVDFHAEWCPPCKNLGPILEQVVTANRTKARLGTFNVDHGKDFAREQEVNGIPDVRFYIDGKLVDRFVGGESKARVEELVAKHTAAIQPPADIVESQDAGFDQLSSPDQPAAANPISPDTGGAKPMLESMAPMDKEWMPPGMTRQ